VLLKTEGHREGIPALRRALTGDGADWTRVAGLTSVLAGELWDLDLHAEVTEWLVRSGRETGSPVTVRLGLSQVAVSAVLAGDFGRAMAGIAEEEAIADALGDVPQLYPRVHLAAMRGRREEALALFADVRSRGTGQLTDNVHWATAVLNNGLADYPAALAGATRAVEGGDLYLVGVALPELVEAFGYINEAQKSFAQVFRPLNSQASEPSSAAVSSWPLSWATSSSIRSAC
jgi:hypothetical protein